MAKQTIDTVKVLTASTDKLRTANQNINTAYIDTLDKKLKQLESCWKGKAGTEAHTNVHELYNMNKARSDVLSNYIRILENLIVPGYDESEAVNTKLADHFK